MITITSYYYYYFILLLLLLLSITYYYYYYYCYYYYYYYYYLFAQGPALDERVAAHWLETFKRHRIIVIVIVIAYMCVYI